jgi:trimeric autotransporter adhesin
MKLSIRLLALGLALVCWGARLSGQLYQVRLEGQITDPSGAVIPSASIQATNSETGVRIEARTTHEGNFVLPPLVPGKYSLRVEANGFKVLVRDGLTLSVGQQIRLNFQLELGTTGESVTVTADAPLLNTSEPELGQVLTRDYVDKLFVPSRNPINLIPLIAGINTSGTAAMGASSGARFSDSIAVSLTIGGGGSIMGSNEITVDGLAITLPRDRGRETGVPSSDALAEMSVKTTNFDASLGHTNGGTVVMATRSGTNDFHGSFEGFFGNQDFNANGWYNNRNRLARPPVNRRFYSGTVGGPIQRGKTFFFFTWEHESDRSAYTEQGRVPSADERLGDFSKTLNQRGGALAIYDPSSTVVNGSTAVRQAFPNAQIPSSRFDPTGAATMKAYPTANLSVPLQIGLANWAGAFTIPFTAYQWSIRGDRVLTPHQKIFGRYNQNRNNSHCDGCPAGFLDVAIQRNWSKSAALNYSWDISQTLLASVGLGFNRYIQNWLFSANTQDPAAISVSNAITSNSLNKAWPRLLLGEGVPNIGGRLVYAANDNYQIAPIVTKLWRSHVWKFGADLRRVVWGQTIANNGAGNFSFNNTYTRSDPFTSSTGTTTGTSMASLLLGTPSSGDITYTAPPYYTSRYAAVFAQDTWKLTSKLTLAPGFRWEVERPYLERFNRMTHGFDRNVTLPLQVPGYTLHGGILLAGVNGNPRTEGKTDWNNFSARMGLAYQLTPKTILRAGYGLFYIPNVYNQSNTLPQSSVFGMSAPITATLDGGATPNATLRNPWPAGLPAVVGTSQGILSLVGFATSTVYDPAIVTPYNQQVSFGIQRQFTSDLMVEASFVHTLTLKSMSGALGPSTDGAGVWAYSLNELPDRYLSLKGGLNAAVTNPFYGILPATSSLGAGRTLTQRQLLLTYPQFTDVSFITNANNANYNALQLRIEKRMSGGLTLNWNYSWSKLMEGNVISLVNAGRNLYGISGLDRPHIMNIAAVYEFPFGTGKRYLQSNRAMNLIAGGWTASGTWRITSGAPMTFTDANGRPVRTCPAAKSGSVGDRIGDRRDQSGTILNPYFNTTCFASLPDQYTVPPDSLFFNDLRSPGFSAGNAALWKSFRVWERVRAEMRAEASNFTNTPQFNAPGTDFSNKATFGVIQSAGGTRVLQLAFRAIF